MHKVVQHPISKRREPCPSHHKNYDRRPKGKKSIKGPKGHFKLFKDIVKDMATPFRISFFLSSFFFFFFFKASTVFIFLLV